jgi:peptidoglycan/xylan/chitin deacetylase (PgdA/CDA1 family)
MEILAECGYRGVALAELAAQPAGKPIVLTFDDGFTDFAEFVLPELQARSWTATMFVPAAKAGGVADWDVHPGRPAQQLLSWPALTSLAKQGVEIGAHGITHTDLTTLPPDAALSEVADSRRLIEEQIGRAVTSFAAPYGRTNPAIRAAIREHYTASVTTELAQARLAFDLHDLPRIEMWYFREPRRWRAYLEGGAWGYFLLRRVLRRARALVS